jgi:hypothetical protein
LELRREGGEEGEANSQNLQHILIITGNTDYGLKAVEERVMFFGRSVSFPFRQTTHTDRFVGWRYLIDSRHRKQLRQRWSRQSEVVTVVEVLAGTVSSLFLVLATAGCFYFLWNYWL